MARPCSICTSVHLPRVSADLVNGLPQAEIAVRYGFSKAAVHRHRSHMSIASSTTITTQKAAAFTALAALPDAHQLHGAYEDLRQRADGITSKAESANSLAVALSGVREMRGIMDSMGRLAGLVGGAQVNVNQTINQTNVNISVEVDKLVAALTAQPDRGDAISRLAALVDAEDPR